MSNIIFFKSKAELSTEQNLSNFITFAREQVMLWNDKEGFEWNASTWPTHWRQIRFLALRERGLHPSKAPTQEQLMSKPFIDFAKAYLRYTQNINLTKTFKRTIAALQLLEISLLEMNGSADITKITNRHLDHAIELMILEGFKDRVGIGGAIKNLAEHLGLWNITTAHTKYWQHPLIKSNNNGSITKNKYETDKEKLPNEDTILAIAEIFANGYTQVQDDEDIFTTCVTCLLLSAPMRINEILHFRVNPLREDVDSNGKKQLYIAYWVPKNGCFVRKEVPEIMADLTREAVRRLTLITDEPRRLALHLENHPEQFYRHAQCPRVPDDQVLTTEELTQALGFKDSKSAESFIYRCTGKYNCTGWTLNSLWPLILAEHKKINPYFPYQIDPADSSNNKPLKMSESLMCFKYQQLSTRNMTSAVLLAPMNRDFYAKRLESRDMQRGTKIVNLSILKKHGYDGLELRSHQLRHFLNTLAQEAGVNIDAITRWSTRATTAQSRVYMHQDPARKSRNVADKLGMAPSQATSQPITQAEYSLMEFGPIITTRYGICTHDYTMTPCNKHADCLNCSELLLCKGHRRSIKAITEERDRIAENLAAAQAEIDAGKRVASRWQQAHAKNLDRLNQLLQVMTSQDIVDGSPIQIIGHDFNHQIRIVNSHSVAPLDTRFDHIDFGYSDEVTACLRLLSEEDNV
ncbi:integrase [Aeromonas media]|uniref:Integrase n=1 Tax=Aeromonas media TaxID=651 RepID=A0AAE6SJR5_AERME|nr:integrase [Aeromonas media]QHQ51943.1 integrase [Aeromonas media]